MPARAHGTALAILLLTLAGCGGGGARERRSHTDRGASCAPNAATLSTVFGDLPSGLAYRKIAERDLESLREELNDEGFAATTARHVVDGDRRVGLVFAYVPSTRIEDEEDHLRGIARELEADGVPDLVNGFEVWRFDAGSGTWYVSITASCTVIAVLGEDRTVAHRIARAQFR